MLPGRGRVFSCVAKPPLSATELFGIAHPDQILSFSRSLNPVTQKLKAGATEVAYQRDGSNTLVRAIGGIAANSTKVWAVSSGASTASAQVTVTNDGTNYTIDNTLVAVKIPMTIAIGTTPVWVDGTFVRFYAPTTVLGPIQGIRHRDGTWTGTGPNYLFGGQQWYSTAPSPGDNWTFGASNFPATSAVITVLASGPLRAKIRINYVALRPYWGNVSQLPYSNTGYFTCTITLDAGQRSIVVEQATDCQVSWSVNMNTGVSADRARYRGHQSSSIAQGHNYDGTVYADQANRPDTDAEVVLSDAGTRSNADWTGTGPWDGVRYELLYAWYTWAPNSGWYWHAYNSTGGSSSNVWGIFSGASSFFVGGAQAENYVGMYGKPAAGTPTEVGFWAYISHNSQNPSVSDLVRSQSFGIFLGSKSTDMPVDFSAFAASTMGDGLEYSVNAPGIAKAHNLYSGTAQFWKQINWGMSFPDPAGGFNGMYLTRADTEALINAIASDTGGTGGTGIYGQLYNKDTGYRDLWGAFNDVTNVQAAALVQWCLNFLGSGLNAYVNLASVYVLWWQYWLGGTQFQRLVVRMQAMFSLDQVRPFLTATQKAQLKGALSIMGAIAWDNDFVPADNSGPFNFGTANMPIQYAQARNQLAGVLATHPQFTARFATLLANVTGSYLASVDAYGSPLDSPHYCGALIVPVTDVLRQLQLAGAGDMFATSSSIYSKLVVTGEWLMQILTPKQSRFGNRRKTVCYADAAAEGHDFFLSMIMGFEASNPTLAKRMAGIWADMGQPMGSFYASSALKIRNGFTTQDAALGDADFPGSFTVMRSAWGTANESAVFLHHGDSNADHAGSYQRGTPGIYLLGAPITTCFGGYGGVYHIIGPWISCSTYIPVNELGWDFGHTTQESGAWNTYTDLNLPCGIFSDLIHDTYVYTPTTNRVDLTCTFSVAGWIRHLTYYRDDLTCPVVRLRDSDTAAGNSIFTLHMLATGAVTLPSGSTFTPAIVNFPTVALDTGTFLPGTPFAISNGACFKFTGQWGVSWDLYYFGPSAQAFIGSFTNTNNDQGAAQYQAVTGQQYREMMYILRINTPGPCDVSIVPYPTGSRPSGLTVTQISGGLQLNPGARTLAN